MKNAYQVVLVRPSTTSRVVVQVVAQSQAVATFTVRQAFDKTWELISVVAA